MARPKLTAFVIDEPVYKTAPLFVLGCTVSEAEAYVYERYHARVRLARDGMIGTMITRQRLPYRIVWCRNYPGTPVAIGELLHEVFHLVTRICGDKGVPVQHHFETGACGDEAAAYLFEFFAVECLRRCRRRAKPKGAAKCPSRR